MREARAIAALDHPAVVTIYDVVEDESGPALVLEWMEGGDLEAALRRHPGVVPELVALAVARAVDALAAAHAKGLVHRDVKPTNLLVKADGRVKLGDFGLVSIAGESTATAPGNLVGSLPYLAPEVLSGERAGPAADVYSMGATLYALLARRAPYADEDVRVLVGRALRGDAAPIEELCPAVSRDLARVVRSCMSTDPGARPGDLPALAEALRTVAAEVGLRPDDTGAWAHFVAAPDRVRTLRRDVAARLAARRAGASGAALVDLENRLAAIARDQDALPLPPAAAPHPGSDGFGPTAVASPMTNLRPAGGRFVGRRTDLDRLEALLARGERLVTILGPPGIGKTSVARQLGLRKVDDYSRPGRGGVFLCDLTEARDVGDIAGAVGRALGVPLTTAATIDDTVAQLGHAIAGRGPTLLILDNFEQVAAHGPATVGAWLAAAPQAAFLVTSREMLKLPLEVADELEPLSLPGEASPAAESEAVQLFVERAVAVRKDFALLGEEEAVGRIVRHLDGLPLAIELAAARMKVLGPRALLERLPRRFEILAGARRDASARAATLRGAIDWSWNLLSAAEQATLSQLSTFRGGFSLDAAEAVADAGGNGAPATIDLVQALCEKSLVRTYAPDAFPGEVRFGLYESIRAYAAERLQGSGGEDAAFRRHAGHYQRVSLEWAETVDRHGGVEALRRLALEQENLIAVQQRAKAGAPAALDAVLALAPVFLTRGPLASALALLDSALARADAAGADPASRARALETRGRLRRASGRTREGLSDIEEALSLARGAGDRGLEGRIRSLLANARYAHGGLLAEVRAEFDEATRLLRQAKDRFGEGRGRFLLSEVLQTSGQLDEAARACEEALEIFREVGARRWEGMALSGLAMRHQDEGRREPARDLYERALPVAREVGDRDREAVIVANLGLLDQAAGLWDDARGRFEQALELSRRVGHRLFSGLVLGLVAGLDHELGRLEAARAGYERALAALREGAHRRFLALTLAGLGAVEAALGHGAAAAAALDEAEAMLDGLDEPFRVLAVRVHRGHLDLLQAREAAARADPEAAASLRRAAEQRAAEGEKAASRSEDVRFAVRVLRRAWVQLP